MIQARTPSGPALSGPRRRSRPACPYSSWQRWRSSPRHRRRIDLAAAARRRPRAGRRHRAGRGGCCGSDSSPSPLGAVLGVWLDAPVHEQAVALSTLGAVTLASCLAGALRRRRERVLAAVRSVAEAAQHALLQARARDGRPVPGGRPLQRRRGGGPDRRRPVRAGAHPVRGPADRRRCARQGTARRVHRRARARRLPGGRVRRAGPAGRRRPDRAQPGPQPRPRTTSSPPSSPDTPPTGAWRSSTAATRRRCWSARPERSYPSSRCTRRRRWAWPRWAARRRASRWCRSPTATRCCCTPTGSSRRATTAGRTSRWSSGWPGHLCDEPSRTLAGLHDELLAHVGGRLHDDAALLLLRNPATDRADRVLDTTATDTTGV